MQNNIMVLTESKKNMEIKHPEENMSENENINAQPPAQKLFSCEELERSIGLQLTGDLNA
jgi:hypothetical protein